MPVVAAVGLAVSNRSAQSNRIGHAMRNALHQAQAEGVTNPNVLKERMRRARKQMEAELRGEPINGD